MVRPSASSTDRVSALTNTAVAKAIRLSSVEEFIPAPQQLLAVQLDQFSDAVDLRAGESAAPIQPGWIQPEFRLAIVAFDVNVSWLTTISRVKEKPIGAASQYGRHLRMLFRISRESNAAQAPIRLGYPPKR